MTETEPQIDLGLRIPMRDGVTLSARLYRPANPPGPVSTILHFSVYIASSIHQRAKVFTAMGFAVLAIDVRGRAESGGDFTYDEPPTGHDGADIVAWVREQAWSDGTVFTRGGSALGNMQWQILAESPEGLLAACPFAATKSGLDGEYINNILRLDSLAWRAHVSGRTENEEIYGDDAFWHALFLRAHKERWSLERLSRVFGDHTPLPSYMAQLAREVGNRAFWDRRDPEPERYARIDQYILAFTGYYDGNQPGTLRRYREHMRHGPPVAKERHFLVIGPWGHVDTMRATREVLGYEFGEASFVPRDELQRDFYRWASGKGERPQFLENNVGWYVTGAEEWRWASSLDDVSCETLEYNLASDGPANSVSEPGHLVKTASFGAPSTITCDPFSQTLAYGGEPEPEDLLISPSVAVLAGDNGVCYETAPLSQPAEISGVPVLDLALSSDAPDFDLHIVLHEILPNGSLFFLTEQFFRARWRNSLEKEELMPIDRIERCRFDRFGWFSRLVAAGSRIRVTICHLNDPSMQRNYNAEKPVAEQTPDDTRVATVRLHHDKDESSRLQLPLSRAL